MNDVVADGYVECSECGHRIEDHDTAGCELDGCGCTVRWTVAQIRRCRREHGLPADWRDHHYRKD